MSDGVTLEAQLQLRVKFWLKYEFTEGIVDYLDSCVVHLPLWLSLRIQVSLDPKVHSCLGYSHGTSLVINMEVFCEIRSQGSSHVSLHAKTYVHCTVKCVVRRFSMGKC